MAPSSSISPSKKLLITDPKSKSKPKPDPSVATPNSAALSATASTASPNQPNLSDCHCCGRRIDHTNPKDRLQLLDSIWRIVLLCRECRKAIRFGRKCPYCFQGTAKSGNLFQCRACQRKIHNDCVRDCENCTPWCYLGGFRVCVDCWVPELLKNSFRVCVGEDGLKGKGGDELLLGKGVKKGTCKVEKVNKLVNARERPIRMARNGVDLGNVVLALPAMNYKEGFVIEYSCSASDSGRVGNLKSVANGVRDRNLNSASNGVRAQNLNSAANGVRVENSNTAVDVVRAENLDSGKDDVRVKTLGSVTESARVENLDSGEDGVRSKTLDIATEEVVDDAELAIQLHRVMNSSPRISRSKSLVNSKSIDVSSIRDWNGLTYKRHGSGRTRGGSQRANMDSKRMGRFGETGLCGDVNGLNSGLLPYMRDKKRKMWRLFDEMKFSPHSDDSWTWSPMKSGAATSEASLDSNADQKNMNTKVNRFRQEFVGYNHTRFKKKVYRANGQANVPGECSSCDNSAAAFKSDGSPTDDARVGTCFLAKSGTEVVLPSESYDAKGDHSPAKIRMHYGIFKSENENQGSEPTLGSSDSDCSYKHGEELSLPDWTSNQDHDHYRFKYAKRVKGTKSDMHSVTFLSEIEDFVPGLTTNRSAESRTVSDVSFDSYTNNLPQ